MDGLTKVHAMGLEYSCSHGKAIAFPSQSTIDASEQATIQKSVAVDGTEYVVEYLARSLFEKSMLRSVVIPNTVRFLPDKCFSSCTTLCDISFEAGSRVNYLGKCCFKRCNLCEIDIPDSCIFIGEKCFDACARLCRVGFGANSALEKTGSFPFRGCKIQDLELPALLRVCDCEGFFLGISSFSAGKNRFIAVSDQCVVSHNGKRLIYCYSRDSTFHVRDCVACIERWCFAGSNVRRVVFGKLSKIKCLDNAFAGSAVEDIVFERYDSNFFVENGILYRQSGAKTAIIFQASRASNFFVSCFVSQLSHHCFGDPKSVRDVTFDPKCNNVILAQGAFKGTDVTTVKLSGVRSISNKCFCKCQFLKSVDFSTAGQVDTLKSKAFSMCGIEKMCVPKGVRKIGYKCFCGCNLLKDLIFEKGSHLKSIKGKAFMGTSLNELFVPSCVDSVTGTSFYGVGKITVPESGLLAIDRGFLLLKSKDLLVGVVGDLGDEVVVPSSIRVIGSHAFYRRGHIHILSFEPGSKLQTIKSDAFKYCVIDQVCLPRRLSSIGQRVTDHLGNVSVEDGNIFSQSDSGYLTQTLCRHSNVLTCATGNKDIYRIPNFVTRISSSCFNGRQCSGFTLVFDQSELCEISDFGDSSFESSDIVSISTPMNTYSLGRRCFANCDSLIAILFSANSQVSIFGRSCFAASSISEIVIPLSVQTLSDRCFCGCTQLENVVFERNSRLSIIGVCCFKDCMALQELHLPASLKRILDRALRGTRIRDLVLPHSLIELGDACLPQTLTKISPLASTLINHIRNGCFAESRIQAIEVPAQILHIGAKAFKNCQSLVSVSFECDSRLLSIDSEAFCGTSISTIVLPDSVEVIGSGAFRCTRVSSVSLPLELVKLGDNVFAECTNLKSLDFSEGAVISCIAGKNILEGTQGCHITLPNNLVKFHASFLPDGCIPTISTENKSFLCHDVFVYTADKLELVRCFRSTERIVIPRFVEYLGESCFENCSQIRELGFEEGSKLRKIRGYAFRNLTMTHLVLPRRFAEFELCAFKDFHLGTLEFESGGKLKTISGCVGFRLCELKLPATVQVITVSAIEGVSHITVDSMSPFFSADDHFLFSKDGTELRYMFDMTTVDVCIPKHVRVLCSKCFSKRRQVLSVKFESGSEMRVIKSHAFMDTRISHLEIPSGVETIEDGAFDGCNGLKHIGFQGNSVIMSVGKAMFRGAQLVELTMESTPSLIEPYSLCGIESFPHTDKKDTKGLDMKSPKVLSGCGTTSIGRVVKTHEFLCGGSTIEIPSFEFYGARWLHSLSFCESLRLRSLGTSAFCESGLYSVEIPASVEHIGERCFRNCENLVSVSFARGSLLCTLPMEAFAGVPIKDIVIPSSVELIEDRCFRCTRLCRLSFDCISKLKRIGAQAFAWTDLTHVTLPRSVELLGDESFLGCWRLTSLSFEDKAELQRIGNYCFMHTKIRELSIPEKVASIGFSCFNHAMRLAIHKKNISYNTNE